MRVFCTLCTLVGYENDMRRQRQPANGRPDSNRKAGIKVCDPRSTEHIVSNLPKYVRLAANIQSKKEDTTQQQPVNTTAFCPHCGAKVRVGVVLMAE